MAKSPKKNTISKVSSNTKSSKAPGKTILPKKQFPRQRRFSLIDSDSSLSDFESDSNNEDDDDEPPNNRKNQLQAIESESEDESESTNEELWLNNSNKVVNTSSEEEEDDDDDDDDDESSSSSDDEDVDFVKLTAERKARSLEAQRSTSPFKSPSPSLPKQDVDFSFDFNNNDHQLIISHEQDEEDLGEELSQAVSPLKHEINPISDEPLGFLDIEDSSESDGDIDKDELLRALEQDSDGIDTGVETGDDEYTLLRQEADQIAQEYDNNGNEFQHSLSTTPSTTVGNVNKEDLPSEDVLQFVSDDAYDSYDDDDDDDDDEFMIPYFDDSVFKEKLYAQNRLQNVKKDVDSDDDSYLWDYFFSSGEEDNGNDDDDDDDDDGARNNDNNQYSSDDEATDEDTTLPPPFSRKKIGSKAQELLSSSSITARPPALGTWSTDSKPFGIIDGLSTRSLLPTPTKLIIPSTQSKLPVTPITNNIEELTLDELLNMSELEDGDNDELSQDWYEVIQSERKVPLSAFRNKGVINDTNSHLNATRRFSLSNSTNGKNFKKPNKLNEITMTPIRSLPKSSKHKRKNAKSKRSQSIAEAAVEGLRVTRSGLFSEDTLNNVEEFLSGLGNDAELSILFREVQ